MDWHKLDWQLYAQVAQVFATLLTGIGITTSFVLGIRMVRELQADRQLRIHPRVIFDRGGQKIKCQLLDHSGIPGIEPSIAMALLRNKPAGTKCCVAKELWGHLINHGTGSALNVSVTFITQKVVKAGEEFSIDAKKLTEFPYDIRLNHVPASPSHIAPGGSARFLRIPTPITCDFSAQISSIEGKVAIEYQNIYGTPFEIHQEFRAFVKRTEESAEIILTFGDELEVEPTQPEQALTQIGDWG
ncbi:MAG TPA: hypothetical protein VGK24_10320 [Candidatus Angelobacter sp.]